MNARMWDGAPRRAVVPVVLAAALLAAALPAGAAVVGTGSPASCTDAAWGAALAAGGTVTFDCGADPVVIDVTAHTLAQTIVADGGELVTLDAGDAARHLHVTAGADVTLRGLTLVRGRESDGGAIRNEGILRLERVTIGDSRAEGGSGGAIYSTGALAGERVAFVGNSASLTGGAILTKLGSITFAGALFDGNMAITGGAIAENGGTLTLSEALVVANEATAQGGGITILAGMLDLTNVTFVSNRAATGGALYGGSGTIVNCTFADQRADDGGTVLVGTGTALRIRNSIFARSLTSDGTTPSPLCAGDAVKSEGFNLAVNHLPDASCAFVAIGDRLDTDAALEALGAHGGFTQTMALPAGSPAVDGSPIGCPEIDQRGAARPFDGDGDGTAACDIGAFEFGATVPEQCDAGADYDGDGLAGCDDPDCSTTPACTSGACAVERTFDSTACRLAGLAALVEAAPELGRFQAPVRKRVDRARSRVAAALDACRSGRSKPATRKLRAAVRLLKKAAAKVGSRRARNVIPASLVDQLLATAEPVRSDLEVLASAPTCP